MKEMSPVKTLFDFNLKFCTFSILKRLQTAERGGHFNYTNMSQRRNVSLLCLPAEIKAIRQKSILCAIVGHDRYFHRIPKVILYLSGVSQGFPTHLPPKGCVNLNNNPIQITVITFPTKSSYNANQFFKTQLGVKLGGLSSLLDVTMWSSLHTAAFTGCPFTVTWDKLRSLYFLLRPHSFEGNQYPVMCKKRSVKHWSSILQHTQHLGLQLPQYFLEKRYHSTVMQCQMHGCV